jgi:hypothetical protein
MVLKRALGNGCCAKTRDEKRRKCCFHKTRDVQCRFEADTSNVIRAHANCAPPPVRKRSADGQPRIKHGCHHGPRAKARRTTQRVPPPQRHSDAPIIAASDGTLNAPPTHNDQCMPPPVLRLIFACGIRDAGAHAACRRANEAVPRP